MRAWWSRRRFRTAREAGTSLVELLVTITLVVAMMALVGDFAVQTQRVTRDTTQRNDDAATARTGMDQVSKVVRLAIVPESASIVVATSSDEDFTFLARYNNNVGAANVLGAPKKIRLVVEGAGVNRLLRQYVWEPTAGSGPNWTYTGTPTQRVLARRLVTTCTTPLFSYLKSFGTATTTAPAASDLFAPPVSAASLASMPAVLVTMCVKGGSASGVAATELKSIVRLANRGL